LAGEAVVDPEVPERPVRRRFTAEYKRRILREADACGRGALGALLRREGLYTSHLAQWRSQRARGEALALSPKHRGPKAKSSLTRELEKLRRENERLRKRLEKAEALIEIQKKLSELLGVPLNPTPSDETE
jgi:transposase-like protein